MKDDPADPDFVKPVEDKLCYAPPTRIPHPPHVWYELDRAPGGGLLHAPRYCDGWAAVTPAFVRAAARRAR